MTTDTAPQDSTTLQFELNGRPRTDSIGSADTLLTLLREQLKLTSVRQGCKQGTCGCCTVVVDGEPRLACLTFAASCAGSRVSTVDGISNGNQLHALQAAFMSHFAAQCGFCTTGMLMAAKALLDSNPKPTREQVEEAIGGNICRCTGYEPIIDAILSVATPTSARAAARS